MNSKRIRQMLFLMGVVLLLCGPAANADSYTFSLIPWTGAVSGPAGSTVGWGYKITNQSPTDSLSLVDLNPVIFQNGKPYVLFTFPTVAPSSSITMSFNAGLKTGLLEMIWDPNAPVGFKNSGQFILSGEFSNGFRLNQFASYTATVSGNQPIPEPSTLLLFGTALAVAAIFKRGRI